MRKHTLKKGLFSAGIKLGAAANKLFACINAGFSIKDGETRVYGFTVKAKSAQSFGNVLPQEAKVIELCLDGPASVSKMVRLRKKLAKKLEIYQKKGYAGFYMDTPNTAIVEFFRRRGATIIPSPMLQSELAAHEYYYYGMKKHGWSKKYLGEPFRRVIVKFPELEAKKGK